MRLCLYCNYSLSWTLHAISTDQQLIAFAHMLTFVGADGLHCTQSQGDGQPWTECGTPVNHLLKSFTLFMGVVEEWPKGVVELNLSIDRKPMNIQSKVLLEAELVQT